jgi:hypothetical protein
MNDGAGRKTEKIEMQPLMAGSVPCRVRYSIMHDLISNWFTYAILLGVPLAAMVACLFYLWACVAILPLAVFLVILFAKIIGWQKLQKRFAEGTILPGVVISTEKGLIATLVNMSNGQKLSIQDYMNARPWHCVKIFKGPSALGSILGAKFRVGARVPVVATFEPCPIQWNHNFDIYPSVLYEGTGDKRAAQSAMAAISEASWNALEKAVREVPPPTAEDNLFLVQPDLPPYDSEAATLSIIVRYVLRIGQKRDSLFIVEKDASSPENGPAREIAAAVLYQAGRDVNHAQHTLASWRANDGAGGFSVTTGGFGHAGAQPVFFATWDQLADVMSHMQGVEFLLKDGTRYRIDNRRFRGIGLLILEPAIDFMRDPFITLKLLATPDDYLDGQR